jgi:hypothetical protein
MEVSLHLFLNLELDGGEWLAPLPCGFTQRGKCTQITFIRRLGETQSWSGYIGEKINALTLKGFESHIVQPLG